MLRARSADLVIEEMRDPPDNSWIRFETADWLGRTRIVDHTGRPTNPREPVHLPELTDDWYAWVRDHMALAGIELSERQPPPFRPDHDLIGHSASLMWPFRPGLQPLPMNGRA